MELKESLRYGTQLHNFVVEAVRRRRDFSLEKMRERHESWRKNDEAFLSYIPEKESDRLRRVKREGGDPQFTTIYIPHDYAMLMSAHTYWTSVFLSRNPIFQYQGTHGAAQSAEQAVETIVNYQVTQGRMLPPLYIWLLDVGKYGIGITGNYWQDEKVIINREVEVEDEWMGVGLGTKHREMRRVALPGYQGNKIYNVRPYDFLPDPRVSMGQLQEGEFCGRYTELGWNAIAKAGAQGKYFNVDILRRMRSQGSKGTNNREPGSAQVIRPFQPGEELFMENIDMGFTELVEMYVELIPRDWGLGDTSFPEKWVFVIANDSVLVHAQPLGLMHNKFPFGVLEYEPDGYAMFKRGMLDVARPLVNVMNWLINTHFYNTRKSLNDMIVVDPSRVVMKDVMDPNPGKIIRLKEEMYGEDVRTAVHQLQVNNTTQAHMQDTQMLQGYLQKVTGVNDSIMGSLAPTGRRTASEIRTSTTFGVNRLKTNSEFFSATGWTDLSQMILQQTQQFMETSKKLRIAGDSWQAPGAQNQLVVRPEDIQGFFDFVPVDGALPIDRFAMVSMWGSLMQQMAGAPQVLAQYDLGKIFAYIAQLGGLKNINNFKIQLGSPEALQQQAAAGNVIPMGGPSGRSSSRARGASSSAGPVKGGGQAAGMGPAG